MIWENIRWAIEHGEVNEHYFHYGIDRKGVAPSDFIPYCKFRDLRDGENLAPPNHEGYNYACLLRDKLVFEQIADSLGYPVPPTLACLDSDGVEWFSPRKRTALKSLTSEEVEVDGFCKPVRGIRGRGAFRLHIQGGHLEINRQPATVPELRERLDGEFLLQERLSQHQALTRLYPGSINTIRIITVLEDGEARPFSVHLRAGASGQAVDSPDVGGLAIPIDLQSGQLVGQGLIRVGETGWVSRHPDTGVAFNGYELPYFYEAVELACRFHRDLRHFHTVGWDLAVTPDGPAFLEGNDNWGGATAMALEPDFKSRFLALFD